MNMQFLQNIFKKSDSFFQNIGLDLGTTKISVYVKGKGIVLKEPAVVALNTKTDQIIAIGKEAEAMLGKTPSHISAIKPIVNGVISDFEVTEKLLRFLFQKIKEKNIFLGPKVIVGVNSLGTEVERKAVEDAVRNAGAKEVYLIEKALATAIGAGLLLNEAKGNLIVDIGGGITEVSIVSLGGIVVTKNIRIAGNKLNDDIIYFVRNKFKLAIGEQTAEKIKITIGSALERNTDETMTIRGRDLAKGLPKEVKVTESEIREAMSESLQTIVQIIKDTLEIAPPELIADIIEKGILLTGGTSLLKDMDTLIEKATGLKVNISDDPVNSVVKGEGIILENFEAMKPYLLTLKTTL